MKGPRGCRLVDESFDASLRRLLASFNPAPAPTEKTSFLEGVATLKKGDVDLSDLAGRLRTVAFGDSLGGPDAVASAQSLSIATSLLPGTSEEVKAANAHLFTVSPALQPSIVRRMGFPDVIVEDDVRSDLYLTLVAADLSHATSRASEKNVEVKVSLVDEAGAVIRGSVLTITDGADGRREDAFHSHVYYHDDRPRWAETIKISIPDNINEARAHVRLAFRHRSAKDAAGDKERPFAIAWLRLVQDNRTIVQDGNHELLVYRVDKKTWEEKDASYASSSSNASRLPGTRRDLEVQGFSSNPGKGVVARGAYSLSAKDWVQVRTLVVSTGLTQNADLLGLLDWKGQDEMAVRRSLAFLMGKEGDHDPKVGEEVVKFLHVILDVLLDIATNTDQYDQLVFDALVYVIKLTGETRFKAFRRVLDDYLDNVMNSTLAYQKLLPRLRKYVETAEQNPMKSCRALQSLEYLLRFIVRSRELFEQ